jgi:hypothetical protein
MKELQKVNLSRCRSLEELPADIGALSALREIEWWHCESLKDVPEELGALNDLQEINLIAGRWRIFVLDLCPHSATGDQG